MAKLDTAGNWMVNDNHLYIPSPNVQVEHTNVAASSTGRAEDGMMHIDWVRRDVCKVYLKYSVMLDDELNYMFNLMQGKEYKFTFLDRGIKRTIDAYTGEFKYSIYTDALKNRVYVDISVNVVEK